MTYSFFRESHEDHKVVPIEKAHGVKRREMQVTFSRLGVHVTRLVGFRRENLLSHSAKYNPLNKEANALMEECAPFYGASQLAQMKEGWGREREKMRQPLEVVGTSLRRARLAADRIEQVARDPELNRLVVDSEFLKKVVNDIVEDKDVSEVIDHFESVVDRDALESFSSWLPGWDVKVGLTLFFFFFFFTNKNGVQNPTLTRLCVQSLIGIIGFELCVKVRLQN